VENGLSQPKVIIVGTTKPVLNYVTACITLFNNGEKRIRLRARGRAINVAVEVVQLLRSRFMNDVVINAANIDGDVVVGRDGVPFRVAVLELELVRSSGKPL
jgi:DNA-binding protein